MPESPRVSIITPTHQRESFLKFQYQVIKQQTYAPIEWLIYDDSPTPSAAFLAIADESVRYFHAGDRLTIGEKRNFLIEQATGEVIAHFDDDDYYSPHYLATMLSQLQQGYDVVKLSAWFLYSLLQQAFGYWDTRQTTGLCYSFDPNSEIDLVLFDESNNQFIQNTYLGFGFSYLYRKQVAQETPFLDLNFDEDRQFVQQAMTRFKVHHFADTAGLCLHLIHHRNTSKCFPQHLLPAFMLHQYFPQFSDLFNRHQSGGK